jgi:glycosyltransferase involved in cell wall biosynthesis
MHIRPERLSTILNGIDHATYHPRQRSELEAFKTNQHVEQPFFLYLSRIEHPGKNHICLIEAYEQFRKRTNQPHLLLLGGSDWHGAEIVHARIAASPYQTDIRLLGFVAEADLPLWYGAATALVHPSLFEGFGLPVVEAMACNTLVATSNRGSLKEVGGPAAIFFDPQSPDNLAHTLEHVATISPAEKAALLDSGLTWAEQFSWARAARDCIAIYDRFLGEQAYSPTVKSAEITTHE